MKLSFEFKNCFGIHSFSHEFTFCNNQNSVLIYAPNGTMKTSFAKTMSVVAKDGAKTKIMDQLHPERDGVAKILVDTSPINPRNIFVIDAEDETYDSSSYCSTFLASKELKEKYDAVYNELGTEQNNYIKKIKAASQSTDCEREIVRTFRNDEKDSFLDCLLRIEDLIHEGYQFYDFRYNDIFDKAGKVKQFLDKHQVDLNDYLERYTQLLSQSVLFHKEGKYSFGTFQASELHKSVCDGAFFGVKHKLVLSDGTEIKDADTFLNKLEKEKMDLLADINLREKFEKITKAIDANQDLRLMKKVIEANPLLVAELAEYEELRRKFWMGQICSAEVLQETKALLTLYKKKLVELTQIASDAKKENETWRNILRVYNSRFHVPFEIQLVNAEDVILKSEVPNLQFIYVNNDEKIIQDKDYLIKNILSKGERRALYILQMLFEIEGRRGNPTDQLLIFDDIADSFDYQNKYAIIEYLKDLQNDSSAHFKCIFLTHNFDFYRIVSSRLCIKNNAFYASRNSSGDVVLSEGVYRYKNPFEDIQANIDKDICYICMVPFVRNIVEYHKGNKSTEYEILTSCLHVKSCTKSIVDTQISDILINYMGGYDWKYSNKNISIFDMILRTAKSVLKMSEIDAMKIPAKVTLAIAIRLIAEDYMIKQLVANGITQEELDAIKKDQERILLQKCKEHHLSLDYEFLESVNVMTPENIHLNSFMYEPLVDMSVDALVDLFNKSLTFLYE